MTTAKVLPADLSKKIESKEIAFIDRPKDETRSAREFGELLKLIKRGHSKEEIFSKMYAFAKWAEEEEHYREWQYNHAKAIIEVEKTPSKFTNDIIPDVASTLKEGIPKIKYVVKHILRQGGLTIIAGEPASKKSLLTQLLSICIVKGQKLFEKFDVQKGKVLWFDFENGTVVLLNRYLSLINGNFFAVKDDLENLFYSISPQFKIDDSSTVPMMYAMIEKTGADVIIIDPFIAAISGDENKSQDVRRLFDNLKPLMEQGKSFIIIHHIGKDSVNRGLNALRGSSDLGGMAEIVLLLTKKGDFTNVSIQKHRHEGVEAFQPFSFLVDKSPIPDFMPIKFFENTPQEADAITACFNDVMEFVGNEFHHGDIFRTKRIITDMCKYNGHTRDAVYKALGHCLSEKILKKGAKQGEWEVQ